MARCSGKGGAWWQWRVEEGGGWVSAHCQTGKVNGKEKKTGLSYLKSTYFGVFVFRKHCYTSSRASHSWSSPWATRRKKWLQRWCKNARNEPERDACRPLRRPRRTKTRRSRGWRKPARPRSKAWKKGSQNRISVPWSATATLLTAWLSPSPRESLLQLLPLLVPHQQHWLAAALAAAPTSKSIRAQRRGYRSAA